jgi:hypothetical protein
MSPQDWSEISSLRSRRADDAVPRNVITETETPPYDGLWLNASSLLNLLDTRDPLPGGPAPKDPSSGAGKSQRHGCSLSVSRTWVAPPPPAFDGLGVYRTTVVKTCPEEKT